MANESFTKKSFEAYTRAVDFYGKYPPFGVQNFDGASSVLSAVIKGTQTDATSTVLQATNGTFVGNYATYAVKAGSAGVSYTITIKITLSDNGKLQEDIDMAVE